MSCLLSLIFFGGDFDFVLLIGATLFAEAALASLCILPFSMSVIYKQLSLCHCGCGLDHSGAIRQQIQLKVVTLEFCAFGL